VLTDPEDEEGEFWINFLCTIFEFKIFIVVWIEIYATHGTCARAPLQETRSD